MSLDVPAAPIHIHFSHICLIFVENVPNITIIDPFCLENFAANRT